MNVLLAVAAIFSFGEVKLDCPEPGGWKISMTREVEADGAEIAKIVLDAPEAAKPPKFEVSFIVPQVGMDYRWKLPGYHVSLTPGVEGCKYSEFNKSLPLYVFFDGNDTGNLSVAASECDYHVKFDGQVVEEDSMIRCKLSYFTLPCNDLSHYETRIRIQRKPVPFADAVRGGVAWMERAGGYKPCVVPDAAFDPWYSTWYSFHSSITAKDVEAECAIAKQLGMKGVILDAGWYLNNRADRRENAAQQGVWTPAPKYFPDMGAHVKRIKDMGLKFMLWYSVSFVGNESAMYKRFPGASLQQVRPETCIIDPRFPEVRRHLVGIYAKALKEWDVDGFKLDFVDSFRWSWENEPEKDPALKDGYAGRDFKSVPLAVKALMKEIYETLTAIKPDILLEFRMDYVGPSIRQYGNILRVNDCPGDMRRNRVAIADLRLIGGKTAIHADMLEWNFNEPPERAALHIINSMFAAVQYSVMLREAPGSHKAMMEKWIRFSREHRETLLKGKFTPRHPELRYPIIEAESAVERIIGVYGDCCVVDVPDDKKTFLMNASGRDTLVVRRKGKLIEVACKSADWIEL